MTSEGADSMFDTPMTNDTTVTTPEGFDKPYGTITADPPWRFRSKATKAGNLDYSTMALNDICAIPVAEWAADSAHLWVWACNGMMEDAYRVVRAWGFEPLTLVTWCKPRPGVGYYLRNNTEHVILASRGKPVVPATKPLSTWFQWPQGRHSTKPAAFYDLVEQVSPGPYLELFARQPSLGWSAWGYGEEVGSSAPASTTCDRRVK